MRTALLGCKWTTLDLLEDLAHSQAVQLDVVVTLGRDEAERAGAAGYIGADLLDRARSSGTDVHGVESYGLSTAADTAFFRQAGIDVLLVIGWERLIPPKALDLLGVMACGMHGSPHGLPRGQGRSPLNWSLLTGRRRFVASLFRYDAGVDAGDVIGSRTFEINAFDTIATLHVKNRIAMQQLVERHLPRIAAGGVIGQAQPDEEPSYYPRRRPEDSGIDWRLPTAAIYDLVRAVTLPYPPAFCFQGGTRIEIIEAYPFGGDLSPATVAPGTIVDVSPSTGTFFVKTRDGSLHVRRSNGVDAA